MRGKLGRNTGALEVRFTFRKRVKAERELGRTSVDRLARDRHRRIPGCSPCRFNRPVHSQQFESRHKTVTDTPVTTLTDTLRAEQAQSDVQRGLTVWAILRQFANLFNMNEFNSDFIYFDL